LRCLARDELPAGCARSSPVTRAADLDANRDRTARGHGRPAMPCVRPCCYSRVAKSRAAALQAWPFYLALQSAATPRPGGRTLPSCARSGRAWSKGAGHRIAVAAGADRRGGLAGLRSRSRRPWRPRARAPARRRLAVSASSIAFSGGGMVAGRLILLVGDPGRGKSTLLISYRRSGPGGACCTPPAESIRSRPRCARGGSGARRPR